MSPPLKEIEVVGHFIPELSFQIPYQLILVRWFMLYSRLALHEAETTCYNGNKSSLSSCITLVKKYITSSAQLNARTVAKFYVITNI